MSWLPYYLYSEIYQGGSIGIDYSSILGDVSKANQHLGFHLSRDQYFGSEFVILYSKTIDQTLKETIDSMVSSVFESGLYDHWQSLLYKIKVNQSRPEESDIISLESMKGVMYLLVMMWTILILIMVIEGFYPKMCMLHFLNKMNNLKLWNCFMYSLQIIKGGFKN